MIAIDRDDELLQYIRDGLVVIRLEAHCFKQMGSVVNRINRMVDKIDKRNVDINKK